mmetsp:Transcript_13169/g.33414  ORF Transcript_13169/g.33414 Transcript_13169/m.33414 type:complete len:215 (-) Transcript_13169:601-1245(-)
MSNHRGRNQPHSAIFSHGGGMKRFTQSHRIDAFQANLRDGRLIHRFFQELENHHDRALSPRVAHRKKLVLAFVARTQVFKEPKKGCHHPHVLGQIPHVNLNAPREARDHAVAGNRGADLVGYRHALQNVCNVDGQGRITARSLKRRKQPIEWVRLGCDRYEPGVGPNLFAGQASRTVENFRDRGVGIVCGEQAPQNGTGGDQDCIFFDRKSGLQ